MKSKINVSRRHFFSATSKVQNYQNKTREKSLNPNKYVLTANFEGFRDIFKHIYFNLYLYQIINNWECEIVFMDHHSLACFFFSKILDIVAYCIEIVCRISGNIFDVFEHMSPCHLLNWGEYFNTLGECIFVRKYFQGTYFYDLGPENYKFHGRYYINTNQKFNFTEDIFAI